MNFIWDMGVIAHITRYQEKSNRVIKMYTTKINNIIQGDCLPILKRLPDNFVDLVFYDPPYNAGKDYDGYSDNLSDEEYQTWMKDVYTESERLSRRGVVIFIAGKMTRKFFTIVPNAELIIVHKRAAGVCKANVAQQYHSILSTAKPVKRCRNVWLDIRLPGEGFFFREKRYDNPGLTGLELTKQVIDYFTLTGDIVLDPFMGSGTTAEACRILGRNFIGIEKSKKYCQMARDRIKKIEVGSCI